MLLMDDTLILITSPIAVKIIHRVIIYTALRLTVQDIS
ncbi:hypothetical protein CHR48_01692 [Weissella cibaria]|nr:hypothetical protein AUC63_00398 [Weissella cibaria]APU61857.1 hypothetical protein AUC65_00003 [Weissella cibaria]APU63963.1 hypothetical protein AUC65_02226 [Weissella cibaria]APU66113.1 hypothetical protein AUC62_02218 [Weissella cibaria]ASS52610.1 hypothetical protein CHR48_01692 [Weissella cibaria]